MDLAYFTTPASGIGPLEWVFLVTQVAVALAGVYFAFLRAEPHPVRGRAVRQLGYALLAVGLVGAAVGALRVGGVAPFTMPIWITIATLFNLALGVFALYYASAVLPGQVAAYDQASRSRGGRPARQHALDASRTTHAPTGTNGTVTAPRPPSGRREARRDRKRKSK